VNKRQTNFALTLSPTLYIRFPTSLPTYLPTPASSLFHHLQPVVTLHRRRSGLPSSLPVIHTLHCATFLRHATPPGGRHQSASATL